MSCCGKVDSPDKRKSCPECGNDCFAVSMTTMLHQVKFPDNQHIEGGEYWFCLNQQCRVGYFSSSDIISKEKLRYFKPKTDECEVLLCYCFDISEACYLKALKAKVSESIKQFVIQKTKLGTCACEIRNPSGRCCLANFKQLEKLFGVTKHDQ